MSPADTERLVLEMIEHGPDNVKPPSGRAPCWRFRNVQRIMRDIMDSYYPSGFQCLFWDTAEEIGGRSVMDQLTEGDFDEVENFLLYIGSSVPR